MAVHVSVGVDVTTNLLGRVARGQYEAWSPERAGWVLISVEGEIVGVELSHIWILDDGQIRSCPPSKVVILPKDYVGALR
jgi:hypothetical protein